jgi:tellurite resistance protein
MKVSTARLLMTTALLAACASPALADDAALLREMQARIEIEDLMWRYVRALDSFDPVAYANVYTEDGQFGSGQNAAKGRAALREMIANLRKGREDRAARGEAVAPLNHVIANSKIEFLGENEAMMHSYWMTVGGSAGPGTTPNVLAVGRGVDHLVRVGGQWLIRSRDVAPQD